MDNGSVQGSIEVGWCVVRWIRWGLPLPVGLVTLGHFDEIEAVSCASTSVNMSNSGCEGFLYARIFLMY
jgi:hypothetical protein